VRGADCLTCMFNAAEAYFQQLSQIPANETWGSIRFLGMPSG